MADFPGLMVPVGADDAALRRVLAQAESRVDQFAGKLDGQLRRVDGAFDRLGRTASGAATAVVALAGVQLGSGIADSLSDAAKSAMAFQTAMAQVGTLLKGADTSAYAAQVKALSKQFGQLPTDQAKALYEIISAGAYSAANAVEVLTQSNKLAIGGVTEVQTAADGLTSVLNSYGAAAGGAANIADAFFASAAAGKTNIKELASFIGQVAPIAAQTGVSLDELLAAAAALTANGIKTSTAMDGMRSVIAAVLKPSQEATAAARALGLEFNGAALKAKGFAGFLQDVAAKTGGSSDSLALLFGGVEALLPVMALASKESTAFAEAQEELRNKAGAADAAYGRIAETAEKTAGRVRAAAEVYRVELGDRLLAAVQPAMAGLADNFDTLAGMAEKSALALGAVFAARGLSSGFTALTRAIDDQKVALYAKAVATVEAADAEKRAAAQDLIRTQQARGLAAATAQAAQAEIGANVAIASTASANLAAAEASLTQARAKVATTTNIYVLNRALAAERDAEMAVIMAREASITADAEKAASLARLRAANLAAAASGEAVAVADAHLTAASAGADAASAALAQRASLLAAAWGGLRTAGAGLLTLVGGPAGAALLAGAGIVAFFASRTSEAEAATTAFSEAQEAARGVVRDAAPDVEALARQYAGLTDAMKAVTRLKLEEALAKQAEAIAAQRRAAAAAVYAPDSSPFRIVEGNHGSDNLAEVQAFERMGLAAAEVDKLRTAFAAFRDAAKDDPEAISALVQTLTGIGRAAGDAGKPLLDLARKLADPATKAGDAAKTAKELAARLALLVNPGDEAARAVLGAGSNATTAATGFQAMGGEVAGLTAKLADLAAKAKLLEVPAGYQRRLAELVGPEPANGDAKDVALWRKKRDAADATLRPIVGLETRDQTAELERQASGQRLLAGAVTDAAKAQAQNRVELAKVALEYPGLGAETAKTLLTTKDFGAAVKALPLDLQQRWAALQSSAQAAMAGATAQGTAQLKLQTEAQARLAAAAGKGEAATRRATIENQVAAAAMHGLEAATRANLEAQEKSTQQQLRADADQPVLARIKAQDALIDAYQKGPAAVQAAEIAETAHTLALKEGEKGTAKYAEAKAHYIALLERQAQGEAAVAAGPLLQQQRDQLELGQRQLALIGATAEQRAVEMARTQALIELRNKNISAASKEGQAYIANAEALARQNLEAERTSAAYQELERFGDRGFDALLDKLVAAGKSTMSWADAVNAVGVEFQQLALKMLAINPLKNALLGSNLPTVFDLGGGSTGEGAAAGPGGGGLTGTITNSVLSKGASWAMDKLGLTGGFDSVTSTPLWTGSSGIAPGFVDTIGATQVANTSAMTGGGATLGGGLGVAGAGALGGTLGGMLGTATNSKAVGGLSGAALGAGAGYLSTVLGLSSVGGPVGLAIGAVVGGIMGLLTTAKKSVGPNGASNIRLDKGAVLAGDSATDNGASSEKAQQIAQAAAASFAGFLTASGGKMNQTYQGQDARIDWMEETNTFTSIVGGVEKEFGTLEAAMVDTTKRLAAYYQDKGLLSLDDANVKTAMANSKATSPDEWLKDIDLARRISDATAGLTDLDTSLAAIAKRAKEAAADQYAAADADLTRADGLGLGDQYRDALEGQIRGTFESTAQSWTAMEVAMAQVDGQTDALVAAVARWGLSITEAEIRADAAAKTEKLRLQALSEVDAALNEALGRGYLNQFAPLVTALDTSRRNLVAVGVAANDASQKAGALYAAQLDSVLKPLTGSQLADVIGAFGDAAEDAERRIAGAARTLLATDVDKRHRAATGLGAVDAVAGIRDQGRIDSLIDPSKAAAIAAAALDDLFGRMTFPELEKLRGQFTGMPQVLGRFDAALVKAARDTGAYGDAAVSANLSVAARANTALGRDYRATMIGFDADAMGQLRAAAANGQDVPALAQVLQLERARTQIEAVAVQIDGQITALKSQTEAIEEERSARLDMVRTLRQQAEALLTDANLSNLDVPAQLDEALRQFRETLTAAQGGDREAAARLDVLGRTAIQAERTLYATTRDDAFREVRSGLLSVAGVLESLNAAPDAQTQASLQQLDELKRLREQATKALDLNTASVGDLKTTLTGAIGNLTTAIGGLSASTLGGDTAGNGLLAAITRAQTQETRFAGSTSDLYGTQIDTNRLVDIARAKGFAGEVGGGALTRWLDEDLARRNAVLQAAQLHNQFAASGLIGALTLPGYAEGGLVTGGTPGRDSVPLLAMPGERILSVPHSRMLESIAAMAARVAPPAERIAFEPPASRLQSVFLDSRGVETRLERAVGVLERIAGLIESGDDRNAAVTGDAAEAVRGLRADLARDRRPVGRRVAA